jgi:hypothetical protein
LFPPGTFCAKTYLPQSQATRRPSRRQHRQRRPGGGDDATVLVARIQATKKHDDTPPPDKQETVLRQAVDLRELRILRALFGEPKGRFLEAYKDQYYRPALEAVVKRFSVFRSVTGCSVLRGRRQPAGGAALGGRVRCLGDLRLDGVRRLPRPLKEGRPVYDPVRHHVFRAPRQEVCPS